MYMLTNTLNISPNTQWKLADEHVVPAKGQQISLGIFRIFPSLGLEASLEGFYKITNHVADFKDGVDFTSTPLTETLVLQGKQQSYGIEGMIKFNGPDLNGWFAYTYSRSEITINGIHPWDKINNGLTFPANYDIPHSFHAVGNYHLSRRITISGVFTYLTGKPATYPVSVYYINNKPYLEYSNRNSNRIPDYFRSDFSLTFEGNLKKHKWFHHSWMFSVYNATGRKNAHSVYFTSTNGKIKGYKYSVIGVPVYMVTWLFKLGNYATD